MKDFEELDITRKQVEEYAEEKDMPVEEVIESLCMEIKDIVAAHPLVEVAETPGAMRILVILENKLGPVGSDILKERSQLTHEEWETARDILLEKNLIQTMERKEKGVGYTLAGPELSKGITHMINMFVDPENPEMWDMGDWIGTEKFE